MLGFGGGAAAPWGCRDGECVFWTEGRTVWLTLLPAAQGKGPRVAIDGDTVVIEAWFPTDVPGSILCCRILTSARDFWRVRRRLRRDLNHRMTGSVVVSMVLLLAVCGWIIAGEEGVRWAVGGGMPRASHDAFSPEAMRRQFDARPIAPAERPDLFAILRDVCRRAQLSPLPVLYCLAGPGNMNAYAVGGPGASAIILTEGLLRGMNLAEISGILAHEVAHIRNNDAWAMCWASALRRAIALTSLVALISVLAGTSPTAVPARPLAGLLGAASGIGQLLWLALSRIRELDADATALDLIDDPRPLAAALLRLEHHHSANHGLTAAALDPSMIRFTRSHPSTAERIDALLGLAH